MKLTQTFRARRGQRQIMGKSLECLAIHRDRFEKPPLTLALVVELLRLRQMLAHLEHTRGECVDAVEHGGIVEVPHDLMPVGDRFLARQLGVEEGLKCVIVPPQRDRRDDLVEIEVAEKRRLRRIVAPWAIFRFFEQYAVKDHSYPLLVLCPHSYLRQSSRPITCLHVLSTLILANGAASGLALNLLTRYLAAQEDTLSSAHRRALTERNVVKRGL